MSKQRFNLLDKLLTMASQYEFQEGEIIRELINYNSNRTYYISNYGTIITLHYNQWRIMKPFKSKKDGHLYIKLNYNGQRKNKGVHQLVAECFLTNPKPEEKTQIHHIDFNPLNNYYLNLCYVSPKEHREIHSKHDRELAEMRNNGNRKNS